MAGADRSGLTPDDVALILAGGAGTRLGGVDKPALQLAGRALLDRALAAVRPARTVVIGPPRSLPADVRQLQEFPPGSGPAAAIAAGLGAVDPQPGAVVVLLAADLPAIAASVVDRLVRVLAARSDADGAVLVDRAGRRQHLISVWRLMPLRGALARRPDWTNAGVGRLLQGLSAVELGDEGDYAADIDTPADLARWTDREPG